MKKTTLVVGASPNPRRYAFLATEKLKRYDQPVYAFGIKQGAIGGTPIINQTEQVQIPDLHTVTLYLNPSLQKQYYDWILALKPKRVIFNPGTENPEFERKLQQEHIEVVEACTLVMLSVGTW